MSPERGRHEALIKEIEAMFAVMEPAVTAATLAVRMMEDRLQAGHDRRTAAAFSVADLAVTRELDLSRLFAHLLDPGGSHAQGATFLSLLLEEIRLAPDAAGKLAAFQSPSEIGSRVETEHWTGKIEMSGGETRSGSIDILVEFDRDRRIAIENKPRAGGQEEQLPRYLSYLRRLSAGSDASDENVANEKFVLLYWIGWTGDGSDSDPLKPLKANDPLRDRFIKMPYWEKPGAPSVVGWLRRCAVACEAPQVRVFLTDLLRYVESTFPC